MLSGSMLVCSVEEKSWIVDNFFLEILFDIEDIICLIISKVAGSLGYEYPSILTIVE